MKNTMTDRFAKVYIYVIGFSIIPLFYVNLPFAVTVNIIELLFWIVLEVVSDLKPFRLMPKINMDITLSFAVQLSAFIILGTGPAVCVVIIGTLLAEIITKKEWRKALFNAGQFGLTLHVAGSLFHWLKQSPANITLDVIADLPALLVSIGVYYVFNTFFISLVISLTSEEHFFDVFFGNFKVVISHFYSLAPISIAVVLLYNSDRPYIILIMAPPLILADQALRRYCALQSEAQETLRVLAKTLDERDTYTFAHSSHVALYAAKIAEKLGLNGEKVGEIEIAGYVHDLGKVGIEDRILYKAGELTNEEYEIIKKHPVTGHMLIKNLKPYKKCAEYVLHHHERLDGNGYPNGISGNNIPLGARILCVADSYDAMTTDRPYRRALSMEAAVQEMKKCSGTQFDPEVVESFITVLKKEYGYTED